MHLQTCTRTQLKTFRIYNNTSARFTMHLHICVCSAILENGAAPPDLLGSQQLGTLESGSRWNLFYYKFHYFVTLIILLFLYISLFNLSNNRTYKCHTGYMIFCMFAQQSQWYIHLHRLPNKDKHRSRLRICLQYMYLNY